MEASLLPGKREPKNMELNVNNTEKASPNSTVSGNPHRNTQLGRMSLQVSAREILSREKLRAGLDKLKLTLHLVEMKLPSTAHLMSGHALNAIRYDSFCA